MFDPYHKWLGIPKEFRPPTYYQLLGIGAGESDPEVIQEAAFRQSGHVRTHQIGPHAAECTRLLNEIAHAKMVLLNPAKRQQYDAELAGAPRPDQAAAAIEPANPPRLVASPPSHEAFADLDAASTLRRPERRPAPDAPALAPDRPRRRTPASAGPIADHKGLYIGLAIGGGVALLAIFVLVLILVLGGDSETPAPRAKGPLIALKNDKD